MNLRQERSDRRAASSAGELCCSGSRRRVCTDLILFRKDGPDEVCFCFCVNCGRLQTRILFNKLAYDEDEDEDEDDDRNILGARGLNVQAAWRGLKPAPQTGTVRFPRPAGECFQTRRAVGVACIFIELIILNLICTYERYRHAGIHIRYTTELVIQRRGYHTTGIQFIHR